MVDRTTASSVDRRTILRGAGALALGGVLAGCSTSTGSGDGGDGGGDGGGATATETDTPGDGGGGDGGDGGVDTAPAEEYASASSNYDGIQDMTGQSSVEVTVGAKGNNGNFAFGPPAIKVSAGTTVTWTWNGEGGQHNVVAEEGASFESDLVTAAGETYEQTFDSTGVVTYFCRPHEALGMKGAVVVV
jgi:halocyanin-like protein